MGKDKFENEDLIRYGFMEDIWFHVDDLSSAHVYLRLPLVSLDWMCATSTLFHCSLYSCVVLSAARAKLKWTMFRRRVWRSVLSWSRRTRSKEAKRRALASYVLASSF
ncbi:protein of unknown function DUF814 [Phytophthora cactorum]|nr:protein of unknown function DUF814 [Phytophthora cactorum]